MKNQLNIFPLQPTLSEFPILANGIIYLVVIARDLEITPGSSFFFTSPLRQTSDPAGFYLPTFVTAFAQVTITSLLDDIP